MLATRLIDFCSIYQRLSLEG